METLTVNGIERQFPAGQMPSSIAELLNELNINAATVAAEIDGQIAERGKFSETELRSGQKIELIRFVGGG